MSKINNLYIYLARLDKKGIKVIGGFIYDKKVYPTRVRDIGNLNMNPEISGRITKEAHDNRMHYELYMESATSFNELKDSLTRRGYTNLPMQQFTGYTKPTTINSMALVTDKSGMTRRNSDIKR